MIEENKNITPEEPNDETLDFNHGFVPEKFEEPYFSLTSINEEKKEQEVEEQSTTEDKTESEQKTEEPEEKDVRQVELERALKKVSKYKNEKATLVKQIKELEQQKKYFEEMFTKADSAAMDNYDKKIQLQFDKAKKAQAMAIESGDVEQQTEALAELAKAAAEMQRVEAYKAQQQAQQPTEKATNHVEKADLTSETQTQGALSQEAQRWINDNAWFDESSDDYDEAMAEEVRAYDAVLAKKYQRMGMSDKIASRQYFKELDNYVRTNIMGEPQETKPVNQNFSKVSPVTPRSSTILSVGNIKLNDTQKLIASRLGLTEDEFKESLIERIKENRARGIK